MTKEKPLISKGEHLGDRGNWIKCNCDLSRYLKRDVKEAVDKLKKLLVDGDYYGDRSFTDLFKRIDKIFGDFT